MLADKMMEKIALSEQDIATMLPDQPGSGFVGVKGPSAGVTATGVGGSLLGAAMLARMAGGAPGAAGAALKTGAVALPALTALWAAGRHMGTGTQEDKEKLYRRANLMSTGGPSWMQDTGSVLTDFRNKLIDQNRRLNKLIKNRFVDRGDGTYFDNTLGRIVTEKDKNASVGHLKLLADKERTTWFSDVSDQIYGGKYVYDPVTRTQKLVTGPGNSAADTDYRRFRNLIRRQASGRGGLARTRLPYRIGRTELMADTPMMSEEDIRRMYMRYMSE